MLGIAREVAALTMTPAREPSPVMARNEKQQPMVIEAKSTQKRNAIVAQPAMLMVWQETISPDGSFVVVQQTYWRVLIHPAIMKEQPSKTT